MKKIVVLVLVAFAFFGCSEELEYNAPAFQAEKDGNLWQANSYFATVDANGVIVITGTDGLETIKLVAFPNDASSCAPPYNENTGSCYDMTTNASFADLTDVNDALWSTNHIADESVQLYRPSGLVNIKEADLETGLASGEFYFNAFSTSGVSSININKGVFYNIPYTVGETQTYFTCVDAEAATVIAKQNYDNVNLIDSAAFEAACNNYRDALLTEIELCGDVNRILQDIIDQLDINNCQLSCQQVMNNTQIIQTEYNNATIGTVMAACNNYIQYLNEEISTCGDSSGTLQAIIDGLDCNDDDGDGVANTFEDINNDGDYTNDDTDGDGVADYLDTDDDDDLINTADELALDADGNPTDSDGDSNPDYLDSDDDNDSILSVNETGDTDGDGVLDYLDTDDDGDGILTVFENPDPNNDGDPNDALDTDVDTIPNYLDVDDDGDSVFTQYENSDPDTNGDPADSIDFDSDSTPDYLDNDDDGDGTLTTDENPDPNGDGNPDDADDTDSDGDPDYLDIT